MRDYFHKTVAEHVQTWFGENRVGELTFLKLQGSARKTGTVSFVVFANGRAEPTFVVRVPRDPRQAERIRAESRALSVLHRRLKGTPLAATIPNVVLRDRVGSLPVLWERAFPGKPLIRIFKDGLFARARVESGLLRALEWLVRFQKQTRAGCIRVTPAWLERHVQAPMHALSPGLEMGQETMRALMERWQRYTGERLPCVAAHGDFNPHNVLVATDGLAVVDWENFTRRALPMSDVLHLLVVTAFHLPQSASDLSVGFAQHVLGRTWYRNLMDRLLGRYALDVGIPVELVWAYLPVYLAEMRLRELRTEQPHEGTLWLRCLKLIAGSRLPERGTRHG